MEAVLELHEASLRSFGGSEGIRDPGALEAAVFQPQNVYFYARGDFYDIAAAYAFHIAESQAFIDGNKRTAISGALVLLVVNGIPAPTQTDVLHGAMIDIARRRLDRVGLADLLLKLFPA